MDTIFPDADIDDADWTKTTWDLPPYKSPEFMALEPDLDAFRQRPVYKAAVAAGLIMDDEWMDDHVKEHNPEG